MAASPLQLTAVAFLFLLVAVVASRPGTAAATGAGAAAPVPPLEERLRRAFSITLDDAGGDEQEGGGGGGMMECFGAMAKLSSCTNEILLFFINGKSYIGDECCRAIRGATRHCWPAMLASIGFTADEADVLRGFCDGEAAGHGSATTTPPTAEDPPAPLKP